MNVQNIRGLDDIHKEMDQLASNFRRIYKTVDKQGNSTGEVVSWISGNAEARFNELQQRCVDIAKAQQ